MTTNQTERVSGEELDQMIWKLERDGMTPKQLSLMRELREVRRAKGDGRDQFEAWFKFHHGEEGSIVHLHRANGGANYADPHVDLAWIAWKDSRAAMLGHSGDTTDMAESVSNRDELPPNSFTNEDLAAMARGDNPQANAYRELLTRRLNSPATPDGWIPVSERMPENATGVLVASPWQCAPGGYAMKWAVLCPSHPDADSNGWVIPGTSWSPTHWMPLPSAPKEVG